MVDRLLLRLAALAYLAAVLAVPVGVVLYRTLEPGLESVWDSVTTPAAISAFWLTLTVTAIAVVLNTALGILSALAIARGGARGRALEALTDLPFAVSPVVVGLALVLLYGRTGWFGETLAAVGVDVVFSLPGIVIATLFISLPLVVREVVPVLREVGNEQEQAAATLGASRRQMFWRVTLPSIRWGVAYGVVLSTARSLGEFGAVSVVSGKIAGETETLTLLVERRFQNFDLAGAYAASTVLALTAIATVVAMNLVGRGKHWSR